METYAFWRPPVRTLTFEDFTTMQKQQGELTKGLQRPAERAGEEGRNSNALCCVSSNWNGDVTHIAELLAEVRGHRAQRGMETVDRPCLMGSLVSLELEPYELEGGAGRILGLGKPAQERSMS